MGNKLLRSDRTVVVLVHALKRSLKYITFVIADTLRKLQNKSKLLVLAQAYDELRTGEAAVAIAIGASKNSSEAVFLFFA